MEPKSLIQILKTFIIIIHEILPLQPLIDQSRQKATYVIAQQEESQF
jgi:hypothetical protein